MSSPAAGGNSPLGPILGGAATAHPLASEAACEVFRAGGNAIDAAVAAAWALSVCEPCNSGLGGQTIMLVRLAQNFFGPECAEAETRPIIILDGHSCAPAAACLESVSPTQQRLGHRATTIPTTPRVLETARRRWGRLSLAQVIEPAIRLADEGYHVTPLYHRQLGWCASSLQASPSASRLFLHNGQPYEVGQRFRQPELASTLRRIARHQVEDFYHGHIARQIAGDMWRSGGLLTLQDLAGVDWPAEREPISGTYRGYKVVTAPPLAGGLQILRGLKLLEQCDFGDGDLGYWRQMLGETTYTVFHSREESARGEKLQTGPTFFHGPTGSWPLQEEPGETTHLCTADAEGNLVSLTQSIQSLFGARAACQPCGFLYNNYLTTCPREAHPHQLAPRCRPRSNSAPTLMEANGVIVALGAAGSRRATSAILQTISGMVDRGMSLAEAVGAPRLHVKLSRKAWLERTPETEPLVSHLVKRFETVELRRPHSYAMGCVQAIQIDDQGELIGVADPRREGTVSKER